MPNNSQPIIEFRNVAKRFGALTVLCGVDLALERGKTTVVIGESGTGKSVLLKHMVGLIRPDEGEVLLDGDRIDNLPERELVDYRKRFGFLFQMGALFDSMTAGENVAFPMREHTRFSRTEIKRIVCEKLAMVGLDGIQNKRPAQLSGGQRKRVALARAIALAPEIILYDEPTTGLDPIRSDTINELIIKLQNQLGVTSIVVTHDMASAFKIADRMIMLQNGDFIADGPPEEFRDSTDARVQQFVSGKSNLQAQQHCVEEQTA